MGAGRDCALGKPRRNPPWAGGRTSEEGGGGMGQECLPGWGWGVGGAVGSIQKSQKATKSGHGQVTFHFPSSPL